MDPRLLPDLMVFLEVVRCGSITRAAGRLHTVQSNVTARIKKLEGALGVRLLKRHARGIKATPAGEATLALALRMDSVLEDLRFTFDQGHGKLAVLRIGAIETVVAAQLPRLVSKFLGQFPNVDVSIQTGSSAAILKLLKDGELDIGLVSRAPNLPGVRALLAFKDELVIVAPAKVKSVSELLNGKNAPLKILVQRLGCSYTERMLTVFNQAAPHSFRLLELGTLEGILGFVEAGLGIAAMPRSFIKALSVKRSVSLLKLPAEIATLETYLVAPAADESRVAVNHFVQICTGNSSRLR